MLAQTKADASELQTIKQELKKNVLNEPTFRPEDNMSMAQIIAKRYKSKIKINKLKTPEDAATVMIKDTKEFNVNDLTYTEGTL